MAMFALGIRSQPASSAAYHNIVKVDIGSIGMGLLTAANIPCDYIDQALTNSAKRVTFKNKDSVNLIVRYINEATLLDSAWNEKNMNAKGMIPWHFKNINGTTWISVIDARARIVLYEEAKTDTLYVEGTGVLLKKGKFYKTKGLNDFIEKNVDDPPRAPKVIRSKRHSVATKRRLK